MHLLKKIRIPAYLHQTLFFGFIFTIFFCGSVGIMNTIDGPQYYTTESVLQFGTIDLRYAKIFDHFFWKNDIVFLGDSLFNQRGYFHTVYTLPLHILGRLFAPITTDTSFPSQLTSVHEFRLELVVSALFSLFSVFGLYFLFKTTVATIHNSRIAYVVTTAAAFGTYIWKYATTYTRQGLTVFIFGLVLWCVHKVTTDGKKKHLILLSMLSGSLYGIDLVAFACVSICLIYSCLHVAIHHKMWRERIRIIAVALIPYAAIISINIVINLHFFGIPTFALYDKFDIFAQMPKEDIPAFLFSTPFIPTFWWVLFGGTPIPPESMTHFFSVSEDIIPYHFALFPMRYNFFGIFFISPFLLFSLFIPAFVRHAGLRAKSSIIIACALCITVPYILINTKWYGFFAANSYDIRYFYPVVIPLAFLAAIGLHEVLKQSRKFTWHSNTELLIVGVIIFSVLMGWMGVLNHYEPFMMGERRIWEDIYSITRLSNYPLKYVLFSTFPNIANIHIPIILVSGVILSQILRHSRQKVKAHV